MSAVEIIILIGSVLTAIGVIITSISTLYRFACKWEKWIDQKDKHDKNQYAQILRLVITSSEMPLSERISAGDTYVNELNRNGAVKQKYNELLEIYKDEHKENLK